MEIKTIDNEIHIDECFEFSGGSTLKNFNKGKITFEKTDEIIKIKSKITLIEHLILLSLIILIGCYQIFYNGLISINFGLVTILLLVELVYFYLFPLMNLNSFINRTVNKIITENKSTNK